MSLIDALNAAYAVNPSPDAVAAVLQGPKEINGRLLVEDMLNLYAERQVRIRFGKDEWYRERGHGCTYNKEHAHIYPFEEAYGLAFNDSSLTLEFIR